MGTDAVDAAQATLAYAKTLWSVDRDQPCGGSVSGLPACSEISQQPLDFTKVFLKYPG